MGLSECAIPHPRLERRCAREADGGINRKPGADPVSSVGKSARDLLELPVPYCDDFTTVNNVTPGADTKGAANAVNAPVEVSISKPATVFS